MSKEIMRLMTVVNATSDEGEMALIDVGENEVLMRGDYYHHKITYQIDGFLFALDIVGQPYDLEEEHLEIYPDDEWFDMCGFYSEEEGEQ